MIHLQEVNMKQLVDCYQKISALPITTDERYIGSRKLESNAPWTPKPFQRRILSEHVITRRRSLPLALAGSGKSVGIAPSPETKCHLQILGGFV